MPYCPKCDMEFIEGITQCTDCKGPLAASAAACQEELKKQKEDAEDSEYERPDFPEDNTPAQEENDPAKQFFRILHQPSTTYVNKRQKSNDLTSSAYAFLFVGGGILLFSILCWTGVIRLPSAMAARIMTQTILTVMGAGSLAVAILSFCSASAMKGGIQEEEEKTRDLITWFCETHTAARIDQRLLEEQPGLSGEELSLKRFDLIQDLLITERDLPDQKYVDALSEEIYGKLFED